MTTTWISILEIAGVLVLTALAATFVTAEYALTTLERHQVETHAEQVADRKAARVRRAHGSLSFQLSGAQLGITLTTLVTGNLAKPAIGDLVGPPLAGAGLPKGVADGIAYVIALLLASMVSVVFGELVPKNLALARPLGTARGVAGFQLLFSAVFRWLINGLNESANWVVRRLGIEPAEELRSARSPQELGSLVRSSAQQGTLDARTATLLARSLRFGDRNAEDVMTPRVRLESLRSDVTVVELVDAARRTGFSRFPVHDGDLDAIHGAVHIKQAFGVSSANRSTTKLASLTRPVPTVPATLEGDALLERLRDSGLQLAIVVDEWGGTAGMVTLEDLVEEILGDVRDEHDSGEPAPMRRLGSDSWLVSGLLRVDEVGDATGFAIPEGEYETLAGMVVARLGRIPKVGDEVRTDGWRVTVMRMDRHRVAELRLTRVREGARGQARGGHPR